MWQAPSRRAAVPRCASSVLQVPVMMSSCHTRVHAAVSREAHLTMCCMSRAACHVLYVTCCMSRAVCRVTRVFLCH